MNSSDYAKDHDQLIADIEGDDSILHLPYYIETKVDLPKGEIDVYIVGAGFSKRPNLYLYCIKKKSSDGFCLKSRHQSRIDYDKSFDQKLKTCISLVTPKNDEERKIVEYINA
jgi:hypothetical protein